MTTLVIYNENNGEILMQRFDEKELINVKSLLLDIPNNKELIKINPETQEPEYIDIGPTIEDRIADLEAQLAEARQMQRDTDSAILDLASATFTEE